MKPTQRLHEAGRSLSSDDIAPLMPLGTKRRASLLASIGLTGQIVGVRSSLSQPARPAASSGWLGRAGVTGRGVDETSMDAADLGCTDRSGDVQ